jgi:hypothetical protein
MRMPLSITVMLAVAAPMAAQEAPVEPTTVATAFKVRSTPVLRAADRARLAELAKPSWHTVPDSGLSLRAMLQSVCGKQGAIVDEVLESEMLRLNGGESLDRVAEAGSAVAVPFCLAVKPVTVKRNDTLEGLLRDNYRTYGKLTVRQAVELNAPSVEAANDVVGFTTTLQPGDEIVLPTAVEKLLVPARGSIGLTDKQIASDIEEITSVLGDAARPVGADVEGKPRKPHEYKYIEFVSTEVASNLPDCGPNTTPWMFSVPQLRARLAVELDLAAMVEDARPATVGVIDTGLRGVGGTYFAPRYFAANRRERTDREPPEDRDRNLYFNDVYGINMNGPTGNGSITPYVGEDAEHGTRVASLVIGGPEWVQSAPPGEPPRVRLKIVNFSSSTAPHPVDSSQLLDAINYLWKRARVDIVNMSLSSDQPVDGATVGIQSSWPLLFVVAAGNQPAGGLDLGGEGAYPAGQGGHAGTLRDRVVTVGAHDNKGRWAPFSNYSAEYVDLLAPGCAVPTSDGQGGIVKEYGTSIATPIVSFVAGLVRSLGEVDPKAIKNRLLASVDVDPDLERRAWTSGRLNAIKAVSVRSDVIETTIGANLLFGRLEEPELLRQFCDDQEKRTTLDNLLKVRPNIPRDGKVWIEYWGQRNDGSIWRKSCPQRLASESIGTLFSNGVAVPAPALQDVRDIVLATEAPQEPPVSR